MCVTPFLRIVFHNAKNITHHSYMSCHIGACGNTNIIHIDVNCHAQRFMFKDNMIDVIHYHLEGGQQVCKAKVHGSWLIKAILSLKSGFVFIALSNMHIVISPTDIKFHVDVHITLLDKQSVIVDMSVKPVICS